MTQMDATTKVCQRVGQGAEKPGPSERRQKEEEEVPRAAAAHPSSAEKSRSRVGQRFRGEEGKIKDGRPASKPPLQAFVERGRGEPVKPKRRRSGGGGNRRRRPCRKQRLRAARHKDKHTTIDLSFKSRHRSARETAWFWSS